jgi:hypothetical protein
VCGGNILVKEDDSVNRCEYCGSPVLGPSQSRDCVNHPGRLARAVCHVCGDLLCEECLEARVGDYGGKLFTIINCRKESCKIESEWAKPLNKEYLQMANMDWADKVDNIIFKTAGLGSILMMVFELFFILSMLIIQYFTAWGWAVPPNIPYLLFMGDSIIVLGIAGNFLSAILLQTALQVYIHERQLASGFLLLIILILEVALLLFRGWFFNLLNFPNPLFPLFLLGGFLFSTILVFVSSLMAIWIGFKKYKQLKYARESLGLK